MRIANLNAFHMILAFAVAYSQRCFDKFIARALFRAIYYHTLSTSHVPLHFDSLLLQQALVKTALGSHS